MDPVTAALLISGGINALQGKRGSDLLKSTISDAALAYATGGAGEGTEALGLGADQIAPEVMQAGIGTGAQGFSIPSEQLLGVGQPSIQQAALQSTYAPTGISSISQVSPEDSTMLLSDYGATSGVGPTVDNTQNFFEKGLSGLEKGMSAIEKPFRDPVTGQISKFRVGLGAGALGAGLYAAGAFKPTPPPEPKYPGYNRFYAADPKMFQPFSGQYGPDTSKYPSGAPYSGLAQGGIASPDDSMMQYAAEQSTPVSNLYAMAKERFGLTKSPRQMMAEAPQNTSGQLDLAEAMVTGVPIASIETISGTLPEAIKRKYIMEYQTDPKGTALKFAQEMSDSDRLSLSDIDKATKLLDTMSKDVKMPTKDLKGILGLLGENEVNVPKAPDSPAYVQKLMELIQAKAVNEPNKAFANGDLVDVLPSKLIRNENDEMNYKRTSGKMVVDETGKGKGNKDTMLAQLADGEFVTKSESVLGAGKLMGGKSKEEQRKLGAQFFYKQMAELEKFA